MGKQFEFYSHKNDDEMIANTLRSVFGELLCVPHYKGDLSPFDICANDRKMYLTGKSFQQYNHIIHMNIMMEQQLKYWTM